MSGYYIVSLIKYGVLGGAIIADDNAMTYKTGKVTVPAKYRNLEMRYEDMEGASRSGLTVTIHMKNGEENKFLVFAAKDFCETLEKAGVFVNG